MTHVEMDGHRWPLGDTIGSGGFARVYESVSPEGEPAVLKLVPKVPGAERELLFEELGETPNVIPILATGEYEGHWVLAMPRAEMSLREHLNRQGPLEPDEARAILADIVTALAALDGSVVHRDLKPENVLRWNGAWCLADFGIARYAEQTTASHTRRDAMTYAYAAPEQWRSERATGATDAYALGVIAYEVLCGSRPFPGPYREDFREQHLHRAAPPLADVPPGLASIVATCLLKPPEARPRPADLLPKLEGSRPPVSGAGARLQQANLRALQKRAEAATEAEAERTKTERRQDLLKAAKMALRPVYDDLRTELINDLSEGAPPAGFEWPFELEGARLSWVGIEDAAGAKWGRFRPAFDVIAVAGIDIATPPATMNYFGCSHLLWYCDAQQPGVFRWYETAFSPNARSPQRVNGEPIRLPPGEDAGGALSLRDTLWDHVWPFTPIDQDDSEAFIDRWLGWFADAIEGSLHRPDKIPDAQLRDSYRV